MNQIFLALLAAAALCSCGGPNYTLSGKAGLAPGDTLRLRSPYENDSVLATTVVRRDSSFRIRGHVAGPMIANLMHNDRRHRSADPARSGRHPDRTHGRRTRLPVHRNAAQRCVQRHECRTGIARQRPASAGKRTGHARAQSETRLAGTVYRQIPGDALEANRDNLLGAFLYSRRTDADPAKAVNGSHSSPPNCRTTPYWRAYGGRSKPSNVRPSAGPTWTSH